MNVRPARADDLEAICRLIEDQQGRPDRAIPYLGEHASGIAAEIEDLDHDWREFAVIMEDDDEHIVGVLIGEVDEEMGRVWWLGPFLASRWGDQAAWLYAAAAAMLPETVHEEELAGDDRHVELAAFAARHDFVAQEASVLLRHVGDPPELPNASEVVVAMADEHHRAARALHADSFPGTHLTPEQLVQGDERRIRLVALAGQAVAGYVAFEVQADESGYIDFLAVHPDHRRSGVGAALVRAAVQGLQDAGARDAHLTVRETNEAARGLYASLGFVEEQLLRPYRRGFSLDG